MCHRPRHILTSASLIVPPHHATHRLQQCRNAIAGIAPLGGRRIRSLDSQISVFPHQVRLALLLWSVETFVMETEHVCFDTPNALGPAYIDLSTLPSSGGPQDAKKWVIRKKTFKARKKVSAPQINN